MTREQFVRDEAASRPPTPLEDAVAWIVSEHGAAMLAYATRLTDDRAGAGDIVQEALVRAWREWDRLDRGHGSLRGWLLTVVRNLVIDNGPAQATRSAGTYLSGWQDAGPAAADLAVAEDRAAVADMLARLSPEERAVLIEIHLRDRSVSQAAAALGIAPRTVTSRAFNALRKLRPRV
jgi:RNA polymerase sigma-70 factor (ECF subfamily)